jgi:hypothetical protein
MATALAKPLYSRRLSSRVDTAGEVWAYWRCDGIEDLSRVCDLSVGGLFLSTAIPLTVGAKAEIDFLVQEGQIRTAAVVRHFVPSSGLGFRFTAITDQDRPQLVTLLNRIRNLPAPRELINSGWRGPWASTDEAARDRRTGQNRSTRRGQKV